MANSRFEPSYNILEGLGSRDAEPLHVNLFRGLPFLSSLLPSVRCSFFDQSYNVFRFGDVDRMASACDFDGMAFGSCGIPPLELRVNGPVGSRY